MPERPSRTFRQTFSRHELTSLAGRPAFGRGRDYALDGRVHKLTATSEQIDAKVRGSASYQVRLWIEDEEAAWACTCPVGREERFCKHAVAVALVATGSVDPSTMTATPRRSVWPPTSPASTTRRWSTCCWSVLQQITSSTRGSAPLPRARAAGVWT